MAQDERLTGFAREMRRHPTIGERELWRVLRGRKVLGENAARVFGFKEVAAKYGYQF